MSNHSHETPITSDLASRLLSCCAVVTSLHLWPNSTTAKNDDGLLTAQGSMSRSAIAILRYGLIENSSSVAVETASAHFQADSRYGAPISKGNIIGAQNKSDT